MAQPMDNDESQPTAAELSDADFQFGLKALVAAYQGMLEEDLQRAQNPQALTKGGA